MILTHLICSNFIIFSLNTKQPLAQHNPPPHIAAISLGASGWLQRTHSSGVLRYHSWTAASELPDASKESFFRDVEIPLMDNCLRASGWLQRTILQGFWDITHGQPPVSFRVVPQNHSSGVLRYHLWTAACAVSLPLLKLRTQLPAVLFPQNCT